MDGDGGFWMDEASFVGRASRRHSSLYQPILKCFALFLVVDGHCSCRTALVVIEPKEEALEHDAPSATGETFSDVSICVTFRDC